MKIYRGKQKVAKYRGKIEVTIDFDDLLHYSGNRRYRYSLDKSFGRGFIFVGLIILLTTLYRFFLVEGGALDLLLNPTDFLHVLPWFSVPFIIYGLYLNRSREEFDFNLEKTDLRAYREEIAHGRVNTVEIDNFFTGYVSGVIDEAYYNSNDDFISHITKDLLTKPKIQEVISKRLNADLNKFGSAVLNESRAKSFDNNYQRFFLHMFSTAIELNFSHIDEYVLFIAIAEDYWKHTLLDFDIQSDEIGAVARWIGNESKKREYKSTWKVLSKLKPTGAINRSFTSRATPMLDEFGDDYTARAAKGEFVVSIGKEHILQNTIEALSAKRGGSVMIVGETGVGKTYFLKHLATRMVVEDVPNSLKDLRMIVIDLNRLMARAISLDDFLSKISDLMDEVRLSGNILLAFEEIGQMFAARGEAKGEVVGLLNSIIRDEKVKVIATASTDSFNRDIKQAKSFTSIFEVLEIPQPSEELSFQIVMDNLAELERKYEVRVETNAVKEIVELAPKVIYEKSMPDKAIDLLEEAIINAKGINLDHVDEEIVGKLMKEKVGVDIGKLQSNESSVLLNLENEMHKHVIGQEKAIKAVASALRRARSGLVSGKRPVANFLFYGPTGVGKTEVAKTLARTYYGSESRMIRLNMSEYHEDENVERLIGFFDKNGDFTDGTLTGQIKKNPFSLLLLDELEKANKKVLDLFLQVFDDGYMNDGAGGHVDFTNTIIIATSNVGSRQISEDIDKGLSYREIEQNTKQMLTEYYRIEFLNRFDKVIMFSTLNRIQIEKIAGLLMNDLKKRLENKGVGLFWEQSTLAKLTNLGYNKVFGARELRRVIQDQIEDKIATLMISGRVKSGNNVYFDNLEVINID